CVPIADVTDGTSNTACYSERVKGIGFSDDNTIDKLAPATTYYTLPYPGLAPATGSYDTADSVPAAYRDCVASVQVYSVLTCPLAIASPGSALRIWHLGWSWWLGLTSQGSFNTVMPPNSKFCTQGNENYLASAFGTSSRHPGGVNMAFADGSVKFIKATTSPPIMWAIGSRNGGEVLNSDQY